MLNSQIWPWAISGDQAESAPLIFPPDPNPVMYSTLQRKVCEATRTLRLTSQRFLTLRLRGFMIIKLFRKAFANCFGKLPEATHISKLFRKAFPNCFAKLPEAGKLFNLAYSSHICAMLSIPEATRRLRKLFFATYCSLLNKTILHIIYLYLLAL